MKITFLGGGALRLLGTVDAMLQKVDAFPRPHLVFMDTDKARADSMATLTTRMPSAQRNMPVTEATDDLATALDGADFVFCVVRVGGVTGMERDERIGASYGYHGHDDFGPSAVMLTARTVPVMLNIAREMEQRCPEATLLVFTNPITNMVDAVERYTSIRSIGLCPGVYNVVWDVDAILDVGMPPPDFHYRGGGLNHVSWITPETTLQGENLMERIFREWSEIPHRPNAQRCAWDHIAPLVEIDRVLPMNNGHQVHFFYHDQWAQRMADEYADRDKRDLRSARQDRHAAEAADLARQDVIEDFWGQEAFAECRSELLPDLGVEVMESIAGNLGRELHVNVPNHGHIVDLPDGAVVESAARVWTDRVEPLGIDPIPSHHKGICRAIAHHQRLLVDASVASDKELVKQALLAEPVIRSIDRALPMFEELWAAATEAGELTG